MGEITAGELWARREALETAGAALLGRFLFEFARVDLNLGLCLVWIDGGSRIDALTRQVAGWGFSRRLEFLEEVVSQRLSVSHPGRIAYCEWISRAHRVRQTRNELVHGRWGIDVVEEKVVNVLGLPTSPEQRSVGYRLNELEDMLHDMQDLQAVLTKLRKRWPL